MGENNNYLYCEVVITKIYNYLLFDNQPICNKYDMFTMAVGALCSGFLPKKSIHKKPLPQN